MLVTLSADFLFTSKINQMAKELGIESKVAKDVDQFKQEVLATKPPLLFLDLSSKKFDPFEAVRFLKDYNHSNYGAKPPRIVGFYSHVEKDIEERARREEMQEIMPRSKFVRELSNILAEAKHG